MPRIKVSEVLKKIDYDKCINDIADYALSKPHLLESNASRSALRGGCDNRNKKQKIFKDLRKSLIEIEKEKLNEEGEILTNKLLGTTTKSRKENSTGSEMDELVQSGGGRKRKHGHVVTHRQHRKKRKLHHKKKTKHMLHHKKKAKHMLHHKKRKTHKRKTNQTKHKKIGLKHKTHHYKKHNIFRNG